MKKRLGLKYSTMNNHYVKGQRVPSKLYKENYDRIRWDNIAETAYTPGKSRDIADVNSQKGICPHRYVRPTVDFNSGSAYAVCASCEERLPKSVMQVNYEVL